MTCVSDLDEGPTLNCWMVQMRFAPGFLASQPSPSEQDLEMPGLPAPVLGNLRGTPVAVIIFCRDFCGDRGAGPVRATDVRKRTAAKGCLDGRFLAFVGWDPAIAQESEESCRRAFAFSQMDIIVSKRTFSAHARYDASEVKLQASDHGTDLALTP